MRNISKINLPLCNFIATVSMATFMSSNVLKNSKEVLQIEQSLWFPIKNSCFLASIITKKKNKRIAVKVILNKLNCLVDWGFKTIQNF